MGNAEPAPQVFLAVCRRDQRQHRMVIAGAQDLEQLFVLEVPEECPAVDDAVDPFLESRVRQDFEQGAGQRKVDPREVLVPPQDTRDAVHGEEDLFGLPGVMLQQILEVAGRLVEIEHECVVSKHRITPVWRIWAQG